MLEADLNNPMHLKIFSDYIRGIGITSRMITNVDTGEHYHDGQAAADILGVSRQAVNNCIHGRQGTVGGYHLVLAHEFRRALMFNMYDICKRSGVRPESYVDQLVGS